MNNLLELCFHKLCFWYQKYKIKKLLNIKENFSLEFCERALVLSRWKNVKTKSTGSEEYIVILHPDQYKSGGKPWTLIAMVVVVVVVGE